MKSRKNVLEVKEDDSDDEYDYDDEFGNYNFGDSKELTSKLTKRMQKSEKEGIYIVSLTILEFEQT